MNILEQEIIEKFHQLDSAGQQRVRELIMQDSTASIKTDFDYHAWLRDVEAIRDDIRASNAGKLPPIDVVGMLRDIRDGEDE